MIHRLVSVPLSKDKFVKEMNTIKNIARNNNININIFKIINRKINSQVSTLTSKKYNVKWIRQPFLGNISYKIASILNKANYRVAFYSINTIQHLSTLKDPTPPHGEKWSI